VHSEVELAAMAAECEVCSAEIVALIGKSRDRV
jgi:hypothetical protein